MKQYPTEQDQRRSSICGLELTRYRFSDLQKEAFRKASNKQAYFKEAMSAIELFDAQEKRNTFHNYLIEHRIFLSVELRSKFGAVDLDLAHALIEYGVGKEGKEWAMQRAAIEKVTNLEVKINEVEMAVQKRLHYEEA